MRFERPKAPRARIGGRALAPGRFPSLGDSVRSRERMARMPPECVISVARAGLDTGVRFSVGCLVLRGFLAAVSSAICYYGSIPERWLGANFGGRALRAPDPGCAAALPERLKSVPRGSCSP